MTLKELSDKIRPCDMNRPFAFISYSSKDSTRVWKDVYHLQQLGYNIWIDLNLKATEGSWKKALEVIGDIYCSLVIFYMSEASVSSAPCLAELQHRESREVCNTHNGKAIPMIPVEVQHIGAVSQFRDKVYQDIISNEEFSKEQKSQKAATLSQLMDSFFPNNDILRVLSEEDCGRRRKYYPEIEQYLADTGIRKATVEELYEQNIRLLADRTTWEVGRKGLEECVEGQNYLPAILMRAFLFETGLCVQQDRKKAKEDLFWASMQAEESEWMSLAKACKEKRKYAEAAAYFAAYGIKHQSAEAFLEASKMWMKMSNANQAFAVKCAELAGDLNSSAGVKLYEGLKRMPTAKFMEFCKAQR